MYQLALAKTNGDQNLLLFRDNHLVSRWAYGFHDIREDAHLQHVGDLRNWPNQFDAGVDLADYRSDLDSGRLEIVQTLSTQCSLSEWIRLYHVRQYHVCAVGNGSKVYDAQFNLGWVERPERVWGVVRSYGNELEWKWDESQILLDDQQCRVYDFSAYGVAKI